MQKGKYFQRLEELADSVEVMPSGALLVRMARKAVGLGKRERNACLKIRVLENGCWMFGFSEHPKNYGTVYNNGKAIKANRFSFEFFKGPLGDKLACHTCDRPGCVNPEHLFAGTKSDNAMDASRKGRLPKHRAGGSWNSKKTHCPQGHPLSGDNVHTVKTKAGFNCRYCKTCRRASTQRQILKRKRFGRAKR